MLYKSGVPDWYGAYLMDSESGGNKIATVRRGLVVNVVEEGSSRHKVEIKSSSSSLVIPHQKISSTKPVTGWVSSKFIRYIVAPVVNSNQVNPDNSDLNPDQGNGSDSDGNDDGNNEDNGEDDNPDSMFSNLINRFSFTRSDNRSPDSNEGSNSDIVSSGHASTVKVAVLEKQGSPNWYGAYMMSSSSGGTNLGTLRKGVQVEILETGSSRSKVRIINASDSNVMLNSSGSSGGEITGWISNKFLNVIEEEPPAVSSSSDSSEDDDSSFFADLRNGFTGFFGGDDSDSSDEDSSSSAEDGESAVVNGMGPEGSDPGNEKWREKLPTVYYVFADIGKGASHFTMLASGKKTFGSKSRTIKNHVEAMIQSDIKKVGRRHTGIIRVKVSDGRQLTDVLKNGKIPSGSVSSKKFYEVDELIGAPCNIAGFCVIGHASTDGPVVGLKSKNRVQISKKYLLSETGSDDWSMSNRLVKGSRISFFGCNTANCQYYLDHSSIAHLLAGVFAKKEVITRGKKGIGNPNSSESAYAKFGLNDQGVAVRLTPEKKDYTFYVPLKDFKKKDSGRKWVYEQISVPFANDDELAELKSYYKERGLKSSVKDGKIIVKAPKIAKVTRSSDKDKLLMEVVKAISSRDKLSRWQRFKHWINVGDDTDEMERAREILPELQKLLNDGDLEDIIEEVRNDNNGVVDEHDFRIWFRIYFQNYKNKNDRVSIPTRACLCDDHGLTEGK